ncbi:hypothetical protein QQ045_010807 [Rhodiola kirilowii]
MAKAGIGNPKTSKLDNGKEVIVENPKEVETVLIGKNRDAVTDVSKGVVVVDAEKGIGCGVLVKEGSRLKEKLRDVHGYVFKQRGLHKKTVAYKGDSVKQFVAHFRAIRGRMVVMSDPESKVAVETTEAGGDDSEKVKEQVDIPAIEEETNDVTDPDTESEKKDVV